MAGPVMITLQDLAEQMGKDVHTLYGWARRRDDPLPLRYERGGRLRGSIVVDEWLSWWARNSVHYQERQ